jgi:hypothetical protein
MRILVVAVLLVAGSACGAYQFPGGGGSPSPAIGTVTGRVLAFPCAPIEPADGSCAGRPVPKLELDYVSGGEIAARAVTDSGGYYSVALEPGSYEVKPATYVRVIKGPLTLTVAAASSQVADYIVDSGIRAPVPQG